MMIWVFLSPLQTFPNRKGKLCFILNLYLNLPCKREIFSCFFSSILLLFISHSRETGENPVRARRREIHKQSVFSTRCRKSGTSHWIILRRLKLTVSSRNICVTKVSLYNCESRLRDKKSKGDYKYENDTN